MKILLTAINSKFIHSNLAVRYLKAFTKDLPYESKIREFSINDREERILKEIIEEKANVVAFSTYIWNVEIVSRVANLIKLVSPQTEILYGGPEVSYDSKDFMEKNIGEYLIEGEGEKTYRDFVEYKLGLRELSDIKGLYYRKNDEIIFNGTRPLMDMDEIVFPYEDDEDLNNKIVYYESSRGCPFRCKYCLSSTTHGVRFHSIERTLEELNFFIKKGVKLVKFVDRTFNCNHKYSMAIWDFLIKADTNTKFHFEISADILKEEEIELLRKAPKGRFQFEVGVQTTNDDVLKNINRFVNFSDIKEKVEELLSINNINQHLDLIAGLPGEDYKSFVKSFNDVHSIKPEEIQLGFLKLLKGSDMRRDAYLYNMKYSPYPPYEILSTDKISYDEIQILKRVEAVVDKYYNSQKFNTILEFFYDKFETPYEFFYELGNYFEQKGYFNKNIGNTEYYKVFLDFNMEILKGKEDYLVDIIRYDYLSFNKKRGIPEFLRSNIDKNIEEDIKNQYREEYSFRKFSVEHFSIDIDKFINENKIEKRDIYYLIGNEGEKIKIQYTPQ
ncbi:MAG: B12-binding domain-containing radical SAM protein [Clostridium sp.]|nr:B12-binding domain-containing radical SAM protein [Clostridium sp.]